MQGFFHCSLQITEVLNSGGRPRVLDFAMSEKPASRDQPSDSRGLALSAQPSTLVAKCSDPDFSL